MENEGEKKVVQGVVLYGSGVRHSSTYLLLLRSNIFMDKRYVLESNSPSNFFKDIYINTADF